MDTLKDDLEALLKEARQQAETSRQKPGKTAPVAARLAWTDPRNWKPTGQVQLIHLEGSVKTLLGLFEEFLHPTGARRLVATTVDAAVTARIETVTGEYWIPRERWDLTRNRSETKILRVVEDLVLDMGVSALTAEVDIHLTMNAMSRVCLACDTHFASGIALPKNIVILPAGMDILEGLTRDTKERLWQEVQRIEER